MKFRTVRRRAVDLRSPPVLQHSRIRPIACLAIMLGLVFPGCREPLENDSPEEFKPSILLVTFPSLRPDLTGRFDQAVSVTPEYDQFADSSDWAGTAVASSSAPVVALRSLMTGTSAWQHQTLTQSKRDQPRHPATLAVELRGLGYRGLAVVPNTADLERYLLVGGFESITSYDALHGNAANQLADHLRGTDPVFVWVHLAEPNLPFESFEDTKNSIGRRSRVTARDLLPFADPRIELPADLRSSAFSLYQAEARRADVMLGNILELCRRQEEAQQRSFAKVVTAGVGFEFGDHSQVMYAQNLERASLEVPLAIELVPTTDLDFSIEQQHPVGHDRVWATLVELAGGRRPARVGPSLLREAEDVPVVSQLFRRNGENLFSLLKADVQLVVRHRYAPGHEQFYMAQLESAAGRSRRSTRQVLDLDVSTFRRHLPFSGTEVDLQLSRWGSDGTVHRVVQPELAEEMARELRLRFLLFSELERTPESEARRTKVALAKPVSGRDR